MLITSLQVQVNLLSGNGDAQNDGPRVPSHPGSRRVPWRVAPNLISSGEGAARLFGYSLNASPFFVKRISVFWRPARARC